MLFEVEVIIEWLAGAASSWLSPVGACAAAPAAVVRVTGSNPSPAPAAAAPAPSAAPAAAAAAPAPSAAPAPRPAPEPREAGPEPSDAPPDPSEVRVGPAASGLNARMIESGSQLSVGWRAPTSASRPAAVGRSRGSLARQRSIIGRTSGGTLSRLGVPWTTRYSSAAVVPVPNGPWPVAA